MPSFPPLVAVLSGDLVGSTAAGPDLTRRALGRIQSVAAAAEKWERNGPGRFTRFRGDGWQFLVPDPAVALRALLTVHAVLRGGGDVPISRISIGIGHIDAGEGGDLSNASGSAFVHSGHALDSLEKDRLFAIAGEGVTPLHRAVLELAEAQVTGWSPEQAEASAYYLAPMTPTLKQIAAMLHISAQAVHARLRGAGTQALSRAVDLWESNEDRTP